MGPMNGSLRREYPPPKRRGFWVAIMLVLVAAAIALAVFSPR